MKKLESTRHIAEGSLVRIYKKGFGYATVSVVVAHDLFIALQASDEFLGAVNVGDTIECYLWVEDVASFDFTLKVIGTVPVKPWIFFCENTTDIVKSKQRHCLGARTDLPIKFFFFKPAEIPRGVHSEKVVSHEGRVIWLEDREAIIKTNCAIPEDYYLKGHVVIVGKDTEIMGKVNSLNEAKHIYNIVFSGELPEDRNRILEYIFTTYRE